MSGRVEGLGVGSGQSGPAPPPPSGAVQLPARGAFDHDSAFGYLARHALPGVETVDPARRRLTRSLVTDRGPEAITVELDAGGVTVTSPERRAGPPVDVLRRVAAWFDLDTDLDAVDRRLAGDPALAAIAAARPGQRIVGYPDGFEATVVTVLGQQVSVRAACTFAGRLAASFGRPGPAGTLAFPSAEDLARVPPDDLRRALGITASRSRTLRAVAELFADGFRIDPASARVAAERARSTLAAVPGLGPWSVEYLAMRALHDPDACPAGDLVLRRALRVERAADVLDRAQAWRPFRAYAVIRLWTASVTGMAELGG